MRVKAADWFVFDLGNVLIRLDFPRVVAAICADSDLDPESLPSHLDRETGYPDLERGVVSFEQFHQYVVSTIGYRADLPRFREVWADFFNGTVEGIEELLARARAEYRVAFLSNSNSVHEEVIPRMFPQLFRAGEPLIFSHHHKSAKPEAELFRKACEILETTPSRVIFLDDLEPNVEAARQLGFQAFLFTSAKGATEELVRRGLLAP